MTGARVIRIVVIDDHPLVHQGVAAIARMHDDLEFVAAAATVEDGLRLLASEPDVALVDLRLAGESGLAVLERGKRIAPRCRFIMISSGFAQASVRQALAAAAAGVIAKDALPEELVTAIRRVAQGRTYLDPSLMDCVIGPLGMPGGGAEQLTERQRDVLIALGRGMGTQQIADALCVTESTVKKHVSEILAKLGLADRTQAALYAVAQGFVRIEDVVFEPR